MTKKAAATTTKSGNGVDNFSFKGLALDFLDTTWRIATPVLIFAGAGIFADNKAGTKPWLTLLGTVIGFIIAGMLVRTQLMAAAAQEDKND
jgi:F0F1-type ATP synthase assembly protein I